MKFLSTFKYTYYPYAENYKLGLKKKIKRDLNRDMYHVYESEVLLLLRYQFFPNWSIESTQSKSILQ